MAKRKQRLKRGAVDESASDDSGRSVNALERDSELGVPRGVTWARAAAVALLGGMAVYVSYYPSDSILVESGDALWFCAAALLLATLTFATEPLLRLTHGVGEPGSSKSALLGKHLLVDVIAWNLAAWMMLVALATSPPNNLRAATNEAWLWVAGVAVFTSARRLLCDPGTRAAMISLMLGIVFSMSIHTLHQNWISLPKTRAQYLEDPEAVMRAAGVEAPEWSSQQMIFANRLFDGGPTAEFALANSLAAVLPIAVLIGVALLIRSGRGDAAPLVLRVVPCAIIGLSVTALVLTHSRSAVAACFVGVAWLVMMRSAGPLSVARKGLLAVSLAGVAIAMITTGFLLVGNEEWMAAAPSSLLFRLRYWRSTLGLLADHPWMGAGPGGFQSMYLRYRLPVSSETIADPHNFVFETLAAGGLVAGVLLAALIWACRRAKRDHEHAESSTSDVGSEPASPFAGSTPLGAAAMFGGGLCSLFGVWLFGFVSRQLPDLEAAVFAVPLGLAAAWAIHRPMVRRLRDDDVRVLAVSVLVVMLLHLSFAGGWTIPGVALWIWLMAALLCHAGRIACVDSGKSISESSRSLARRFVWAAALGGVALILCLRVVSLGPVQASNLAQLLAADDLKRGLAKRADENSLRALTLDPWSIEPALWRSQWLRGELVRGEDAPAKRKAWEAAVATVMERSGENPLVLRALAEQSLHFYQRFGNEEDLDEAERLFSLALDANPTDVSLIAQMSLLRIELGDHAAGLELARRAETVSLLDGNVVQALGLQHVYAAEKIGKTAAGNAILRRVETEFDRRIPAWRASGTVSEAK